MLNIYVLKRIICYYKDIFKNGNINTPKLVSIMHHYKCFSVILRIWRKCLFKKWNIGSGDIQFSGISACLASPRSWVWSPIQKKRKEYKVKCGGAHLKSQHSGGRNKRITSLRSIWVHKEILSPNTKMLIENWIQKCLHRMLLLLQLVCVYKNINI